MQDFVPEAVCAPKSRIVAEGKTKIVTTSLQDPALVYVLAKNDITAGDGAKRDQIKGKAAIATMTASNVFRFLKSCGIPVAFQEQVSATAFTAPRCVMLPCEVVVRREAHGSYLKRAPHLAKGHVFPKLVVEFFLKTSAKKWQEHDLPCDDPCMRYDPYLGLISLFDPRVPDLASAPASPFLTLSQTEVFRWGDEAGLMQRMSRMARSVFLILEKAWHLQGRKMVDLKVEFGFGPLGELLLADVIDNDSWRVVEADGTYLDKQVYREGGDLDEVAANYRKVADLTGRFVLPVQRLILWRGSEKDDFMSLRLQMTKLLPLPAFETVEITCSAHKQPVRAYHLLQEHLAEVPDTVIIAYVGKSNGAGPMLAANAPIPVITVPVGYWEFPEDVWSSLRAPSNAPVLTVLEPANAVLAALQILGMRNPALYAALRFEQEELMTDV